ncbi:MAG: InlB B-repeat-containing protein, partial [Clostridium sp.]|nr:InlB B-repeat-containing protein [Clostridium sp.]
MAAVYTGGTKVKKIYIGGTKVKKAYAGAAKVYSSGNVVTYRVDSGVTYTEEADEGASCLSPATFTPTKSGWTFLGWREDGTASSSVLSSKTMGEAAVTLYAVFRAAVTLSFTGNGSTSGSTAAKTG